MREADFVEQYKDRVGAGTTAARLEIRRIAGACEVASSSGICEDKSVCPSVRHDMTRSTYESDRRDERTCKIPSQSRV